MPRRNTGHFYRIELNKTKTLTGYFSTFKKKYFTMKIIAFGGSISQNSINKKLATYVANLFENFEIEILDLNDFEMPLFSVDREKVIGHHELAKAFLDKIAGADLIVTSIAENNHSFSAAFKNLWDWCSRIDEKIFQGKAMFLMTTSDGKRGGVNVMEIAKKHFPRYGAEIKATFSFPSFYDNFDIPNGKISNPALDQQLKDI